MSLVRRNFDFCAKGIVGVVGNFEIGDLMSEGGALVDFVCAKKAFPVVEGEWRRLVGEAPGERRSRQRRLVTAGCGNL